MTLRPADFMTWRLALTGDGKLLACGGRDAPENGFWYPDVLGCWDVHTGKVVASGEGPRDRVNFAAFSPDDKLSPVEAMTA